MHTYKIEAMVAGLLMCTLFACSSAGKVKGKPRANYSTAITQLEDSLGGGHLGVYVETADGTVVAAHNARRYFVPASNTKLLSLYAGLKYLPDSLPGLRYHDAGDTIFALPTGDPTLLEDDFKLQPVVTWLQSLKKPLVIAAPNWKAERYGRGWTWSDYQAAYQPERSAMPVYGNRPPVMVTTRKVFADGNSVQLALEVSLGPAGAGKRRLNPEAVNWEVNPGARFSITRAYSGNAFTVRYSGLHDTTINTRIPLVTNGIALATAVMRNLANGTRDTLDITELADHPFFNHTGKARFSTLNSQ
nr:D-alanyl-D-alanine carboxypeptidase [Chitinophagaceae bacterium]